MFFCTKGDGYGVADNSATLWWGVKVDLSCLAVSHACRRSAVCCRAPLQAHMINREINLIVGSMGESLWYFVGGADQVRKQKVGKQDKVGKQGSAIRSFPDKLAQKADLRIGCLGFAKHHST